jgi:hypothetical protein
MFLVSESSHYLKKVKSVVEHSFIRKQTIEKNDEAKKKKGKIKIAGYHTSH